MKCYSWNDSYLKISLSHFFCAVAKARTILHDAMNFHIYDKKWALYKMLAYLFLVLSVYRDISPDMQHPTSFHPLLSWLGNEAEMLLFGWNAPPFSPDAPRTDPKLKWFSTLLQTMPFNILFMQGRIERPGTYNICISHAISSFCRQTKSTRGSKQLCLYYTHLYCSDL